jgi:ABC-type multidrug transport system ATPase subunit
VSAPAIAVAQVTARIEARALTHRYGRRVALEPLDFVIEPGVTAITGPNGSGKSTLLRIISGLLRPTAGECRVSVGDRSLGPGQRRGAVGLATPELSFYDELSALENLAFAAEARGLGSPAAVAGAALERVELMSRAQDRVGAFSSGMRQRLRLAFAALGDPPILLLDEPGSHLDEAGRSTLERWIAAESRRGLVLLATNEEREWRLAERRIQLRGRNLGHTA